MRGRRVNKKNGSKTTKNQANAGSKRNRAKGKSVTQTAVVSSGQVVTHLEPSVNMVAKNTTRIRHSEFVKDLSSSSGFSVGWFGINPGDEDTFPWLSQVAQRFEKYHFTSLEFEYRSRSSTSQTGSIILMIDYDASDDIPVDKQEMLATTSVDAAPWMHFSLKADAFDLHNMGNYLFVRSKAQYADIAGEINVYDAGSFYVAHKDNNVSFPNLGELWVHYDVLFCVPQINSVVEMGYSRLGTLVNSKSHPFTNGTGTQTIQQAILDPFVDQLGSSDRIRFSQLGHYLVEMVARGNIGPFLTTDMARAFNGKVNMIDEFINIGGAANELFNYSAIIEVLGRSVDDSFSFNWNAATPTVQDIVLNIAPYFKSAGLFPGPIQDEPQSDDITEIIHDRRCPCH